MCSEEEVDEIQLMSMDKCMVKLHKENVHYQQPCPVSLVPSSSAETRIISRSRRISCGARSRRLRLGGGRDRAVGAYRLTVPSLRQRQFSGGQREGEGRRRRPAGGRGAAAGSGRWAGWQAGRGGCTKPHHNTQRRLSQPGGNSIPSL